MDAVRTEIGILSLIQEQEEQIRSFGVKRLGLFGSFVRGQQKRAATWTCWWSSKRVGRPLMLSFSWLSFWRTCWNAVLSSSRPNHSVPTSARTY